MPDITPIDEGSGMLCCDLCEIPMPEQDIVLSSDEMMFGHQYCMTLVDQIIDRERKSNLKIVKED